MLGELVAFIADNRIPLETPIFVDNGSDSSEAEGMVFEDYEFHIGV